MKNLVIICAVLFTLISKAQEIKFGKVSKQELEEKIYVLDSTADAAYILKERKTTYDFNQKTGFSIINKYHYRIKVYTKEGIDKATFNISYFTPESGDNEKVNSIKGYSFNLDTKGKVVKKQLSKKDIFTEKKSKNKSLKKFTIPEVKEGTVIDLKYQLVSPYSKYIDDISFQTDIPIKNFYTKVEIPEWLVFNKYNKGFFTIQPTTKTRQGELQFSQRVRTEQRNYVGTTITSQVNKSSLKLNYISDTYVAKNIEAINDSEPFVSHIKNYYGGVKYELSLTKYPNSQHKNYSTSWEDVCKSIYNSSYFGDELKKDGYYKEDLNQLLSTSNTDFEKISSIFQFVKSKVKWNTYYGKYTDKGVRKAYKEGTGNAAEINLMLTSMLRSAGIKANPVLVSTKNNGIPLFPTLDGYNYVITKVNLSDNKYILLDATDTYASPNTLPYRALNWFGREIFDTAYSQSVNLIPVRHAKENNILQVKIDDLGEIQGMLRKSLTGHGAMYFRKKNNGKKEEDIITSLEEEHSIEIEDFKILNKNKLSKPVNQTLKFTSEDLIEEINGKLYFSPMLFLATDENPFKSKKRTFPIDYAMPWQDQFSVAITIPENYTVESYPEDLAIGLPEKLGLFKYKVIVQGNKIKLSSVLQINSSIIAPHYYDVLKDFYKQLVEKQTEKIVLAKK